MSDSLRDQIRNALEFACTSQSIRAISHGRNEILSLPREHVLEVIESVAAHSLPCEEWEYRRLLELYELLDPQLLQRLIARGLASEDPDINEAARDFQCHGD